MIPDSYTSDIQRLYRDLKQNFIKRKLINTSKKEIKDISEAKREIKNAPIAENEIKNSVPNKLLDDLNPKRTLKIEDKMTPLNEKIKTNLELKLKIPFEWILVNLFILRKKCIFETQPKETEHNPLLCIDFFRDRQLFEKFLKKSSKYDLAKDTVQGGWKDDINHDKGHAMGFLTDSGENMVKEFLEYVKTLKNKMICTSENRLKQTDVVKNESNRTGEDQDSPKAEKANEKLDPESEIKNTRKGTKEDLKNTKIQENQYTEMTSIYFKGNRSDFTLIKCLEDVIKKWGLETGEKEGLVNLKERMCDKGEDGFDRNKNGYNRKLGSRRRHNYQNNPRRRGNPHSSNRYRQNNRYDNGTNHYPQNRRNDGFYGSQQWPGQGYYPQGYGSGQNPQNYQRSNQHRDSYRPGNRDNRNFESGPNGGGDNTQRWNRDRRN